MPNRIQLRRKGWRKPEGAVVVSRQSKWGNPHVPGRVLFADGRRIPESEQAAEGRRLAVRRFRRDLQDGRLSFTVADVRRELRGKDLCCWCPLPERGEPDWCHAAVLLEVANDCKLIDGEVYYWACDTHAIEFGSGGDTDPALCPVGEVEAKFQQHAEWLLRERQRADAAEASAGLFKEQLAHEQSILRRIREWAEGAEDGFAALQNTHAHGYMCAVRDMLAILDDTEAKDD